MAPEHTASCSGCMPRPAGSMWTTIPAWCTRPPIAAAESFTRGVLDKRSRGVFHGRIRVDQGAVKTDADQTNDNLLLSPDAEIDTKPQLEIYADDVKCAHGATVGQLDANALFYLRSRGIDP